MGRHTFRISRRVGFVSTIILALGMFAYSQNARAVIILPGQSLVPAGTGAFVGSLLGDTGPETFTGTDIFSNIVFLGSMDSRVYRDTGLRGTRFHLPVFK